MWHEYKTFLFRGNLVDVAAAFILGATFATVTQTFTDDVVMRFISALVGQPSFDSVALTLRGTDILVGAFASALVNFLLVATVLFFVVRAAARFQRRSPEPETPAPDTDEVVLLREIRDALVSRPPRGAGDP